MPCSSHYLCREGLVTCAGKLSLLVLCSSHYLCCVVLVTCAGKLSLLVPCRSRYLCREGLVTCAGKLSLLVPGRSRYLCRKALVTCSGKLSLLVPGRFRYLCLKALFTCSGKLRHSVNVGMAVTVFLHRSYAITTHCNGGCTGVNEGQVVMKTVVPGLSVSATPRYRDSSLQPMDNNTSDRYDSKSSLSTGFDDNSRTGGSVNTHTLPLIKY